MEMDISPAVVWVAAISSFLGLGTTIWNMLTSGSKQNSKKLDELDAKMTGQESRLNKVENELKHLPTKDQVHDLRVGIADLEGSIRTMEASMSAINRTVSNIDTYLRREDK